MDKPTVQDIFNRFYPGYLERHTYAASGTLDELCADPKYLGANPPHPCFVPEVPRQVHGGIEEALAGRPPCVWRDIRKIPKPLHIP